MICQWDWVLRLTGGAGTGVGEGAEVGQVGFRHLHPHSFLRLPLLRKQWWLGVPNLEPPSKRDTSDLLETHTHTQPLPLRHILTSLVVQWVKNLPAVQETQVRPLGPKDVLEKEMAPHSNVLSWKIPWMEEHGGLQSMGSQRVRHD